MSTRLGRFACDVLDWHKPAKMARLRFAQLECACTRCGRTLLLDSQGNWFAVFK